MWLAVVALAAGAVAVYEWWLKPNPVGGKTPLDTATQQRRQLAPSGAATSTATAPAKNPMLTAPIEQDVPAARAWLQNIAHTGFNVSMAGDSLVNGILLVSEQLGKNAVPSKHLLLAEYGKQTGRDWSSGLPVYAYTDVQRV